MARCYDAQRKAHLRRDKDAMKTREMQSRRSVQRIFRYAFTASEVCHILSLIACNERNGEHTAPQDQYWKRSERIKAKLASTPNAPHE